MIVSKFQLEMVETKLVQVEESNKMVWVKIWAYFWLIEGLEQSGIFEEGAKKLGEGFWRWAGFQLHEGWTT